MPSTGLPGSGFFQSPPDGHAPVDRQVSVDPVEALRDVQRSSAEIAELVQELLDDSRAVGLTGAVRSVFRQVICRHKCPDGIVREPLAPDDRIGGGVIVGLGFVDPLPGGFGRGLRFLRIGFGRGQSGFHRFRLAHDFILLRNGPVFAAAGPCKDREYRKQEQNRRMLHANTSFGSKSALLSRRREGGIRAGRRFHSFGMNSLS